MPPKSTSSIVWAFFGRKDETATCKLCSSTLKYSGSTSSLLNHLKVKHPINLAEVDEARKKEASSVQVASQAKVSSSTVSKSMVQPTLVESMESKKLYDIRSPRRQALDRLVLDMIALDLQPFRVVEDIGFRQLIKALDPRYELPSRTKLSRTMLPAVYEEERMKVANALEKTTAVSLTTDLWTSRTTQGYLTVTAHCLTPDWQVQSFVLETSRMAEAHTADNIAGKLRKIMFDWKIQDKVSTIVTDNASSMSAAIAQLGTRHLTCFGHNLNLVVTDSLKGVPEIISTVQKVKDIVTFFHHSVKASDQLRELQCQRASGSGFIPLKLIQDVATRWNSTFYMLERYVQLHSEVTTALCFSNRPQMCIDEQQLKLIKQIVMDLQPFEMATKEMSGEKFTTLAKVIPLVQLLHEHLRDTPDQSSLARELQKQLRNRYPFPQKKFILAATTFLDPRFKKHAFSDQQAVTEVQEALKTRMRPVTDPEDTHTSEEPTQPTSSLWGRYDAKVQTYLSTTAHPSIRPNTELRRILEEDPIPRSQDPLVWWRAHESLFPQLQGLARRYLAIPATSVPSERLFSKAGELVSQRRASLKDSSIDMILFLNKNSV